MSTDFAMPDFYTETLVVARKEHKCCETGRIINKGDRYWRLSGKWDGETRTYKRCESAHHFAGWLDKQDDGDGAASLGGIRWAVIEWPKGEAIHDVWASITRGTREFGPGDEV